MRRIAAGVSVQRKVFPPCSLLLGLLVGCGSGTRTSTSSPVLPTPVSPVLPTSPAATVKPPINGLVAMGDEGFNSNPSLTPTNDLADPLANPNVYTAAVVLVTWKQLQPTNATSFDSSAVDAALTAVTAYNASHTKPLVAKLRVFAGVNTPTWAQNLDGPPVTGTVNGVTASYPRYWTANYTSAWKNLQNLLAAKYDSNTLVAEVAVSGCSSMTAEPFIHNSGIAVIPILQQAGYTDAQYMACLSSMGDQYSGWTTTPLDYTFNTFTALDTGSPVTNSAFTLTTMAAWRASLSTTRGVIANHGLQPVLTTDAQAIYPEFTVLGPPLEFQSYGPTVDWNATVALAVSYKCSELEIWTTTQAHGQAVISLAQLQSYAGQI